MLSPDIITRRCTPVPMHRRRAEWRNAYEALPVEQQLGIHPPVVGCPAAADDGSRKPRRDGVANGGPSAAGETLHDAGACTASPATIHDPEAYGREYERAEAASADYVD